MRKELLTHIGIGAILVLVLAAAFVYLSFDIGKRVDKIKESRSSLDFHSQIAELLFALRADFNAVSPYILGIENILPSRDELVNFSRDLSAAAGQNSVSFPSKFSGENLIGKISADDLKWIGVDFTLGGGFDNIVNFLKTVENSRYSIKLNALDLSRRDNDYRGLLNGKVFYF